MPYLEDGSDAQPYSSMAGRLHPELLKGLDAMNFQFMTPVQQRVLTGLPDFRSDCLVQAKTGTGKTVAFLLPALNTLLTSKPLPRGQVGILVISPTRELALQIAKECDQLTSQTSRPLECHTAFGGTARATNLNKFMNGSPSVLVATPGRLKDYLSEAETARKLSSIQTLILDEADTMLESGFLADVKAILRMLPSKASGQWQGMCFSATIPDKVRDVISVVLKPGYTSISTIDKSEPPTLDRVPQYSVIMPSVADTFNTLLSLLTHESTKDSKIIVFGVTANMVALFAALFSQGLTPLKVSQLQSRLSQNIRTRTTNEFKDASSGLMFASDVVGRGMDFPNVDLVIQVGLPSNAEQYVHRVGRTGRAGAEGRAVILLTQGESFFLAANRHLPVRPHAKSSEIIAGAATCAPRVEQAMYQIDETIKQRAYSSYLGFFAGSGLLRPLRLDKPGLVQMANEMAIQGMHCAEPPAMEKNTIGKMGLKGIPGFNFASTHAQPGDRPAPNYRQRTDAQPNSQKRPRSPRPEVMGGGMKRTGGGGGGGFGGAGDVRGFATKASQASRPPQATRALQTPAAAGAGGTGAGRGRRRRGGGGGGGGGRGGAGSENTATPVLGSAW